MRHPSEIKKFVKKNGTYMLKRAKSGKNDPDDLNPDDSGVDEPLNKSTEKQDIQTDINNNDINNNKKSKKQNEKNHSKNTSKSMKLTNDSLEHDDVETNEDCSDILEDGEGHQEASQVFESDHEDEKSEITGTKVINTIKNQIGNQFPFNSFQQSVNNNTNNGEILSQVNNTQSKTAAAAMAAAAMANRLYPDIYSARDMFQYYAQYLPNPSFYPRIGNNDDVSAAQHLLQLRNNQSQSESNSTFIDPSKQFFNETIKNLANSLNSIHRQTLSASSTSTPINNTSKSSKNRGPRSNETSYSSSSSTSLKSEFKFKHKKEK